MTHQELIHFSTSTIDALNNATTNRFAAVATAAREAVDHDRTVTVRTFSESLRAVNCGLGMSQAVLAASIKAAKDGGNVESAMTDAALNVADKARKARARAKVNADKRSVVKALESVEETLAAITGRDKSPLLLHIEEQKGKIDALVADLKSARETLAQLEARYLAEQTAALKSA